MQRALKDFGDPCILEGDPRLGVHLDSVPTAFREIMGYYISGVPRMNLYFESADRHIATLLVSD
ncbi:hypothetical protein Pmar_PMAR016827, partial [Perkinsus marinus ATCC 50983]